MVTLALQVCEGADFPHAALDLVFGSGQGDAYTMARYRAKATTGSHRDVALVQQVKRELPSRTLYSGGAGDINEHVECAMWGVAIATVFLEEVHGKVAAVAISIAHFVYVYLGTSEGGGSSSLNQGADVGIAGVEHVDDGLHKLRSCDDIADAPTRHGVAFREGVDADETPGLKLLAGEHGSGAAVPALEDDFVVAFIGKEVEIVTAGKIQ